MANEDRRISGSVSVASDSGSPERVAKDLWYALANNEKLFAQSGNRKVLLDLYAECLQATKGYRDLT